MNVNELIEHLQGLVEQDEANGEREVLGAHQRSYPLQERIGGVWDPKESEERVYALGGRIECAGCGTSLQDGWRVEAADEGDDEWVCDECHANDNEEGVLAPVYVVLDGHHYDHSPYAPAAAWNCI